MSEGAHTSRVLILDADQRSALAATRSLGRRGLVVVAADETPRTLAGASRYCRETMVYPSPSADSTAFVATLAHESVRRRIDMLLPMSDLTTRLLLEHRAEFGDVRIPCPSLDAFNAVSDKWELYARGRELDIPMPRTALVRSRAGLAEAVAGMAFPLVVKPPRSRMISGGRWVALPVRYATSVEELDRILAGEGGVDDHPYLVQEYVSGRGQGVFGLYAAGKVVTLFAHRRLREKPPSGGVSVLSESVPVNPRLREISQRLLDSVGWHGVAMVEFKVTPDGSPYLIEVNGRFWGSLQLAIDAGVDFPWLLHRVALGEPVEPVEDYAIGARNLWLLGDLDHLYLRLKEPGGIREKWRALRTFLGMFESGTRHEVNRWDDLRPFLREVVVISAGRQGEMIAGLWQKVARRLARAYEHRRMVQATRQPGELAGRVAAARAILFVCTGNIIRSAFAAELLRSRSLGRVDVRVLSAGLDATTNGPAHPTAVQCARRFGVDLSPHRTHRLNRSDIEEADILLAMEIDHVVEIHRRFPQHRHKVYLFGCLNDDVQDVADPVSAPTDVFEACFERIDDGVRRIVEMLPPRTCSSV